MKVTKSNGTGGRNGGKKQGNGEDENGFVLMNQRLKGSKFMIYQFSSYTNAASISPTHYDREHDSNVI